MDEIDELLTRGVDKIYPSKEALEKVLRSGKKLRLYQGFDPTGDKLHIGHMVGLRKLAQWQALGHHVIFLIGDGTGQAGDPSGKLTARDKFLTNKELRENAKSYVQQAGKIVRFDGDNPVEILYNGDWLNKLNLVDILKILNHFSHSQLAERDLFEQREKSGGEVSMREFVYPILQAYDSVAMNVDLEIGGSDQTFNMLRGRDLVKKMQQREKFVLTTPLLTDSQGRKIGKTEGNVIALTDSPSDLFGKIMSLSDDVVVKALEYLTKVPMEEIKNIEKAIDGGENPMTYKKKLAFEIVSQLNDEKAARKAQDNFERVVQKKETPADMLRLVWTRSQISTATIADGIRGLNLASSNSDIRRITQQGGTVVNNQKIDDPNQSLEPFLSQGTATIQFGKRKFGKIDVE